MKKFLLVPALAAFFAVQSASAVSIIQITDSSIGPANPQLTFEVGFANGPQNNLPVLGGALLTYDGAVIVQGLPNNGNGAAPYPDTQGKYLSVMAGGNATFQFADASFKTLGFMWGSVDLYNSINFSTGVTPVGAFTGANVAVDIWGNQQQWGSAYVVFAGSFDKVVLTSSTNSFEIDNVNVSVPDGGMTLALLGLSLLGLPFIRRFIK